MDEIWTRIVKNMMGRVSGPMKFRLLLQPTMAAIFAIRAGLGCEEWQAAVLLVARQ